MNPILRRELLVFGIMVLVFAPLIHPDLLSSPVERFTLMAERGNFFHPLLYTLIPYLLIALFRFIYYSLRKFFSR